jgi:hypothetical protein
LDGETQVFYGGKNFGKEVKTMVGIVFGVDRDYHGKGVEGAMIKWTAKNML